MPESVFKAFMVARMTVLQKPDGGIRGIVIGTGWDKRTLWDKKNGNGTEKANGRRDKMKKCIRDKKKLWDKIKSDKRDKKHGTRCKKKVRRSRWRGRSRWKGAAGWEVRVRMVRVGGTRKGGAPQVAALKVGWVGGWGWWGGGKNLRFVSPPPRHFRSVLCLWGRPGGRERGARGRSRERRSAGGSAQPEYTHQHSATQTHISPTHTRTHTPMSFFILSRVPFFFTFCPESRFFFSEPLLPPKKCQSEGGPGLTFPNVKNDAGASVFFEGVAGLRQVTFSPLPPPPKKDTDNVVLCLPPVSLLTSGRSTSPRPSP